MIASCFSSEWNSLFLELRTSSSYIFVYKIGIFYYIPICFEDMSKLDIVRYIEPRVDR